MTQKMKRKWHKNITLYYNNIPTKFKSIYLIQNNVVMTNTNTVIVWIIISYDYFNI